jgi:hypothetical protein
MYRSDNGHDKSIIDVFVSLDATIPCALLPSPMGLALDEKSKPVPIRLLLDSGASYNIITVGTLNKLSYNTVSNKVEVRLHTLNDTRDLITKMVSIFLVTPDGENIDLTAVVVEHIAELPAADLPRIEGMPPLTEPFPRVATQIDLLIGMPFFHKITDKKIGMLIVDRGYCFFHTHWGYAPGGWVGTEQEDCRAEEWIYLSGTDRLSNLVEKQWKLEELPHDSQTNFTKSEILAVQQISTLMQYDRKQKRFTTGLLWANKPDLANNYVAAKARFDTLMRKLSKDPILKCAYRDVIQEYRELGVIEPWEDPRLDDPKRGACFVLPHRAVVDFQRISTKVRVVFDASARTKTGLSLNDNLLAGPPLQLDIVAIGLRFRIKRYVAIGDISKMFLQINMRKEDRDYLRFLWHDPDSYEGQPKLYRFCRVVFGVKDSPFQAITALQKLVQIVLQDEGVSAAERDACHTLTNDTYVDDVSLGADTESDLIQKISMMSQLLDRASFDIRKFYTNSEKVLKTIPTEKRGKTVQKGASFFQQAEEHSEQTSTLGIKWIPGEDVFTYDKFIGIGLENKDTKRCVASLIGKVYDPMGIASPFVLTARKIMKQTFKNKLNWTEKLSTELIPLWHEWVSMIPNLQYLQFPRYIPTKEAELHCFGDASETGYGTAVYVRALDNKNRLVSNLILARSRIAPMKEQTIPRLELMAALNTATVARYVATELNIETNNVFCYTDSEITLFWLKKEICNLIPFVGNRCEKIHQLGFPFSYVPTDQNPGDICSRGVADPKELQTEFWLQGPTFLQQPKETWKKYKADFTKIDDYEGIKKQKIFVHLNEAKTHLDKELYRNSNLVWKSISDKALARSKPFPIMETYSSYEKCIRVLSTIYYAIFLWKNKTRGVVTDAKRLDKQFYTKAKQYWCKNIQAKYFSSEISRLKQNQPLKTTSPLINLDPFIDELGIMRVGGRLAHASLSEEEKHPVILPNAPELIGNLIWKAHREVMHGGVDQTHFHLRQAFWIISARQAIRKIIRHCFKCKRMNARRGVQKMGNLPSGRLSNEPAFTHTGVDYCGPIDLKYQPSSRASIKGYIIVFCCMSCRAIHLEATVSLRTEDFLMAFKRFLNIYGNPKVMYSDNATYFRRADSELMENFNALNKVLPAAAEKFEFQWKYSVELASHTGGAWERLVGMVKTPLAKILGKADLYYVELVTILREIQGALNDRPLVAASEDTFEVITPSHLLLGRRIKTWNDEFSETQLPQESSVRAKWKHRQITFDKFWHLWTKTYQIELQRRSKWYGTKRNLKIGDLVLIEKSFYKRIEWPLALVVGVNKGKEGLSRSVELRVQEPRTKVTTKDNKLPVLPHLTRSIQQVFPLELAEREGEGESIDEDMSAPEGEEASPPSEPPTPLEEGEESHVTVPVKSPNEFRRVTRSLSKQVKD